MISNQKMNESDWDNLLSFRDTLPFGSLEKLIDIKVYNAAQKALIARTIDEVADQRGYARALREIIREITEADKELAKIKKRKESNAKKEEKEKRVSSQS